LLWGATDTYETRDGRQVVPGVDRAFSPTPPPECGDDLEATPAGNAAAFQVTGSGFRFDPSELRVAREQQVVIEFVNAGKMPHTLTVPAVEANTGSVGAGESATLTFTAPNEAGSYEILCSFGGHPEAGMVGTLLVE
jgi:plastocyanin